nr:hypothetical protein [Smithella sp.]
RLDAASLHPWSRWITPRIPTVTRARFDTRFFIAALPEGQHALHDTAESSDGIWLRPRDALQHYWDGAIEFAPPQIMTLDNEEAEINVGSNVPYVTRQDQTNVGTGTNYTNYSSYEYRDVGVILKITPNINQENFIRLKIDQQVTKVQSGADEARPTTLKRTAKTTVIVKDNETVVIGGLVGDSTDDSTYKFPLLGDIPLLGWLFKTKTSSREKTNLYVFLTPHIVRTQADAAKIYQEKRETMGEVVEGVIKLNEKADAKVPLVRPPVENETISNP